MLLLPPPSLLLLLLLLLLLHYYYYYYYYYYHLWPRYSRSVEGEDIPHSIVSQVQPVHNPPLGSSEIPFICHTLL
jgi:hypothetical protein